MVHACYGLDKDSSSSHLDKLLLGFVEFKLAMNDGRQGVRVKVSTYRKNRRERFSKSFQEIRGNRKVYGVQ